VPQIARGGIYSASGGGNIESDLLAVGEKSAKLTINLEREKKKRTVWKASIIGEKVQKKVQRTGKGRTRIDEKGMSTMKEVDRGEAFRPR